MSPGVRHGSAPVVLRESLNWGRTDGRWIVMLIIIDSDHVTELPVRLCGGAHTDQEVYIDHDAQYILLKLI